MYVCCKSSDTSLWFAGERCEYTNQAHAKTYIQPNQVVVMATSADVILFSWLSPPEPQIVSHRLKYKPKVSLIGNYIR